MQTLLVHQYSYLSDNYGILLHCPETGETACIDTGDTAATLAALTETHWTLSDIWITHHHADHSQGLIGVKASTGAKAIGPATALSQPIQGLDATVNDDDIFQFAGRQVQVLHTPGHTKDMMNFYLPEEQLLFSGDTLFTLGCGRLFEGDAEMMFNSLSKLRQLPLNTKVYSSHEYTLSNAQFALSIEPNNPHLQAQYERFKKMREQGQATVPSSIGDELESNPFLRTQSTEIRKNLKMESATDTEVFAEIRKRKDQF